MPTAQIARPGDLKSTSHPWQPTVKSAGLTTPPMSPTPGDRYIVAEGATGAWEGHVGEIAYAKVSGWGFYPASEGWMIWDESANTYLHFYNNVWVDPLLNSNAVIQSGRSSQSIAGNVNILGAISQGGQTLDARFAPIGDKQYLLDYILSRGMNLVTNGFGSLSNNYNFSYLTFDVLQSYAGKGSFKATSPIGMYSDEFIFVDPNKYYRGSAWLKSTVLSTNKTAYVGVACFDIERNAIGPHHFLRVEGATSTTLAAQLNPGATTITLTNATGWYSGSTGHSRNIAWYPYTDYAGRIYPDYSYTRNTSFLYGDNGTNGAWAQVGISGNVITLRNPWQGPTLTAGTKVANCLSGNSFQYSFGWGDIPNTWTLFSGEIGGVNLTGLIKNNMFPPGTAFVKIFAYLNIGSGSGNVTNISAIWFSEVAAQNLLDIRPYDSSLDRVDFWTIKSFDGTKILAVDTLNKRLTFGNVPIHANNAAAVAAGLTVGQLYRTNSNPDYLCIVH
jgi:hypothetical protein